VGDVPTIKKSLTSHQVSRLSCAAGPRNLSTIRSFPAMESDMTNETLTVRIALALLAVAATAWSVVVLQFALVVA
jgi:hypothetical protein